MFATVLIAALAALGGLRAVTGYLGGLLLDVTVGLLIGQWTTHYFTTKLVARRRGPLLACGSLGLLSLSAGFLAQWEILTLMRADLPRTGLAHVLLVLVCWLVPPLMCLLGLTVVPRRWNRLRPMTQIRWSVIAAIGREIDRSDKELDIETARRDRRSITAPLRRAYRRATGEEEILPGPAR